MNFINKIFEAFITVFIVLTLTFFLLRSLPGGPFDEENILPSDVKQNLEQELGLSKSILNQYTSFLHSMLIGEMGVSYQYLGRSVKSLIKQSLPYSVTLGLSALLVALFLGISFGIYSAYRQGGFLDRFISLLSVAGVSVPSFLSASILVYVFCFYWNLLPSALGEGPRSFILPVVVLSIKPLSFIFNLVKASAVDIFREEYIKTAKAKGLSERRVLFKHVLKNSLIPVLTYLGPTVAGVLSGSFIVEIMFAIPGLGKYFVESVVSRDYPLVLGITFVYSCLLITCNLLTDFFYTQLDPRLTPSDYEQE